MLIPNPRDADMRRADRLFQILQLFRSGKTWTAHAIAAELEVSDRTIYRDIRDLQTAGVPLDGAAGVGYILRAGFDLPPLMFDRDEAEALAVGARMLAAWGGNRTARAAERALQKIRDIVPADRRVSIDQPIIFAPDLRVSEAMRGRFDTLYSAIEDKHRLEFDYCRADGTLSHRTVWPLALLFWGGTWTLGSWCELRTAFRSFRVDRMEAVVTRDGFPEQTDRSTAAYMHEITVEHVAWSQTQQTPSVQTTQTSLRQ